MPALAEVRHLVKLPALPRLTVVTLLAVAALYVPTFYKLFTFGWDNADYSHGPLILAAFLWLMWRKRDAIGAASPLPGETAAPASPLPEGEGQGGGTHATLAQTVSHGRLKANPPCPPFFKGGDVRSPLPEGEGQGGGTLSAVAGSAIIGNQSLHHVPPPSRGRTGGGWGSVAAELPHPHPCPPLEREGALFNTFCILALLFGIACYATGSVHGSMAIESFSMVPVFVGASGFLLGKRALKELLFPLGFLLFLVPPPLVLTDMLTSPLKMLVATAAAWLLKTIGYLVTRHGATILMSDYSITVGDPCSGMRSLIALTSVGALYAHLLQSSKLKKGILFFSTVPISVMANIVRLMMLCLITYYWGEAAAEGFLHKFSGFVLFVVSLVSLFLLDVVMHRRVARDR